MAISLTKLAETSSTITVGWQPVAGAIGYRFLFENADKPAHTWDPQFRRDANFPACNTRYSKVSGAITVEALTVKDSGVYPPATSPPPPSSYPASFFTGPLGSRNPVPKDPAGAFTNIWAGGVGWPPQQTRDHISRRMADCGRTFDFVMHQVDQLTAGGVSSEQWVHSLGCVNIIDWGGGDGAYSPATINSGSADASIAANADRYKAFGQRMMLRLFHEFNGNWFPWSATVQSAPAWIQAYRRVVSIFRDRGASNVGFVWCPTEGQDRSIRDACYPGDEWVDWVSTTAYNANDPNVWCTPFGPGWARFREIFDYTSLGSGLVSTYTAYAGRKPFVITESSSKGDTANAQRKGDWFREVDSEGLQNMPNLAGVTWFDQDLRVSENHDWRVDMNAPGVFSNECYQGFKDLVRTPRWNVGVA